MSASASTVASLLRGTALFGALDEVSLRELEREIEVTSVPGGEALMREGDLADCLYVVVSGRLRAFVRSPEGRTPEGPEHGGREQAVGEIGRGESVGEMALLIGGHRSATVRAVRDTHLLKLSKAGFDRLVDRHPETAVQLARMLVTRLDQTLHAGGRASPPVTLAVVPLDASRAPAVATAELAAELAALGPTVHLASAVVDGALGPGAAQTRHLDPDNARLVDWLSEREARHRFVLYETDATPTAWTQRCLRQADRVLVLSRAGPPPPLGELEAALWREMEWPAVPRELVLLHEASIRPGADVREWLRAPRRFAMHHHVRAGVRADFQRLARMLTGRAIGVVLGGGGARAFAHIGVLRALGEAGVPIDLIGGTSMGAVLAAQHAAGWDYPTMLEANRKAFVLSGSLFDYTLPLMSLIGGQRFVRMFMRMFGETHIEDLPLKYFCVSTDLTRGEARVHETGHLARWLSASVSVPGLAPPVFDEGNLLVDGSVLDTVPAGVMRRFGRGPIVAVDVTAREDVRVDPSYRWPPSAWRILWSRLNPLARRIQAPSIYTILLRTTMLSSMSAVERLAGEVDLYIHPPVERFDLLDWRSLDRLAELGYETASRKIAEWRGGAGFAG